jgi:sulfur-oxidizing protein SoxZ
MSGIRIKAALSGDTAVVKCLMTHPMETGFRKDAKTGQLVPAHHIVTVRATIADRSVLDAQWGGAVSSNPFLEFRVKGAKAGDKIVIGWEDNKGEKDSAETTVG